MKFDKNTLIGLVLIFGLVIGFSVWQTPSSEERAAATARRDSLMKVEMEQQKKAAAEAAARLTPEQQAERVALASLSKDSAFNQLPDSVRRARIDSATTHALSGNYGGFSAQASGTPRTFVVETDLANYYFSNKGGQLETVELKEFLKYDSDPDNKKPVKIYDAATSGFNLPLPLPAGGFVNTEDLFFSTEVKDTKISGEQSATVSMKAFAGNSSKYVEFLYVIKANNYMADFTINLVNCNSEIKPGAPLQLEWKQGVTSQEKDPKIENTKSTVFYMEDGDVDDLGYGSEELEEIEKPLKWIGFSQQFFSSTLVADGEFNQKVRLETRQNQPTEHIIRNYKAVVGLPYSGAANESYKMHLYNGPKDYKILKKYDLKLQEQLNLGWKLFRWINTLFIINVFQWLDGYGLGYGLIILILTLMVKLILSPITYRTFVSSAKMRILKPDIDALNEKFKDADAMKKQQELMSLYNRAGVNPLAGCIPALLQMPLLFAMFSFFPASIELRGQRLFWADDLSSWDSIYMFPNGFEIPLYGAHISLFALLMTATTVLYTRMTQNVNTMSGAQATQMKIMMYVMPVAFLVFLNSYSAALSYYYFLANGISIIQTLVIRHFIINEQKLRAKIEENKARPKTEKKGGFAARLAEMQKVQQQRSEELKKKKK